MALATIREKRASSFYVHQYKEKLSPGEEILVFRWFQLLEQHYHLFVVKNKHQCFVPDPTQLSPTVVQPFASVDYFFGCVVCGKYHFCRQARETCEIHVSASNSQQVCLYSGHLLIEQENLVPTFEDGNHFDHEACYFTNKPRKALSVIEAFAKKKRPTASAATTNKRKMVDLFRPVENKVVKRHKKTHQKEILNTSLEEGEELYEISIDTLEEDESYESDEEEEERRGSRIILENEEDDSDYERLDEEWHADWSDELRNENEDGEVEEQERSFDRDDFLSALIEEEAEESDEEYTSMAVLNTNGDGRHSKNYHNNLKYRNEYYSFLRATIAKQKKSIEEKNTRDKVTLFLDLYDRDIQEEQSNTTNPLVSEEYHQKKERPGRIKRLDERVRELLANETRETLSLLLQVEKRYLLPSEKQQNLVPLCEKFLPLIENITLLLYESPILEHLSIVRGNRNHNQNQHFSFSSIDTMSPEATQKSIDCHARILPPSKICRALLLHLFLLPFSLYDDHQHRVAIWQRDAWLRSFTNKQTRRIMLRDFHTALLPSLTNDLYADFELFKNETVEAANLILEALEFYRFCPLWLRYRVFKFSPI